MSFPRFFSLGLLLVMGASLGRTLPAQRSLHDLRGQSAGLRLGAVVAGLDDINGDSAPEFAAAGQDRVDVFDGATGSLRFSILGPIGQDFGAVIRGHFDTNFDGYSDIVIGAPAASNQAFPGSVLIYSGFDGSLLKTIVGSMPGDHFGSAIEIYDDYDGNGIADLVIAASHADTPVQDSGTVYIYDPFTGIQSVMLPGVSFNDGYGSALAVIEDVTGDGFRELAVGTPRGNQLGTSQGLYAGSGMVTVHKSGGFWNPLIHLYGSAADDFYGSSLAAVGDVDGDGVPDLAIGSPGFDNSTGSSVGLIEIRSLPFGAVIASRAGLAPSDRFGDAMAALMDVDGDAIGDLIVGAPNAGVNAVGRIEILRGHDAQLIHSVTGQTAFENLGTSVSSLDDYGFDGVGECLFGAPGSSLTAFFAGRVQSLSFRLGAYGAAAQGVTVANYGGGQRPLRIDANPGGFFDSRKAVGIGQPFNLSIDQPINNPSPASFVIWAAFGIPAVTDGVDLPYSLGRMVMPPAILFPGLQPWLFTLVDGFGLGLPAVLAPSQTPFFAQNPGISFPLEITMQGLIESAPGQLSPTNAIVLVIE